MRAYHRPGRTSLPLLLALLGACPDPANSDAAGPARPGADCQALIDAARRAESCDPELGRLADLLEAKPDELACRTQARQLLAKPGSPSRIRSIYEKRSPEHTPPLAEQELRQLAELSLPGIIAIHPDLPPGPGRPSTTISLDEHVVPADQRGHFVVHVPPGEHTLILGHAGESTQACVRVDVCERVELTAHGPQFAHHERVSPGACGQPGLEVAAGER